jgi:hypothetical protein
VRLSLYKRPVAPLPELSLVEGHDKGQILSSLKRSEGGNLVRLSLYERPVPPLLPELSLVKGHEAEVEAGEEAGQGQQHHDEDPHQPDREQERVNLQL